MQTVLVDVLGLLLRIGIPLAVTILIIYLLRRMDKRWQAVALPVPVAAPRKPCWEVNGCSGQKRKNCPAAAQPNIPCWQVFRAKNGVLKEGCLVCEVFRQAPLPGGI
jgi:hypothetical protein